MKTQDAAPIAGSLHQRILDELEGRILSGEWPPGHRIPFEVELSAAYGCSRMTVNKALSRLADAGLIERRRKAGSFVARPKSQSVILDIHDIRDEVTALGAEYRFTIAARSRRAATQADRRLIDVAPGAPLLAVRALHFADGRPFCSEDRLIHLGAVPEAETEPFDALPPGSWLVARVPWTDAEHRIAARGATKTQAAWLDVAPGVSCLVIERRTWRAGEPITFVELSYPGALHRLVARFTPAT